jgi:hypothetical protein
VSKFTPRSGYPISQPQPNRSSFCIGSWQIEPERLDPSQSVGWARKSYKPGNVTMNPFENFTDEEITSRLSIPLIVDAFWYNEYGCEVAAVTREVGCSLMYLVRKYGTVIPHQLLLQAASEHADLSESTVGPFIAEAAKIKMITVLKPEADERQRLYGFLPPQKKKILRASGAYAYAAALSLQQAKQPTDVTFGRTPENESYYKHIFNRINDRKENIVEKLANLKKRIAWMIAITIMSMIVMQPLLMVACQAATWSTGNT